MLTACTYSAYNFESPVFDFGPKWYLEVAADGTVTAPFNTEYFAPMSQWLDYVYQFVGASANTYLPYMRNSEGNIANGHFPVTISADKNTITINPVKYTYKTTDNNGLEKTVTEDFYPNTGRYYNGQMQFYSRIIAPIVLTRNGAAKPSVATPAAVKGGEIKGLYEVKGVTAPKSRTAIPATEKVTAAEKVNYRVLSAEQFNANCEQFSQKRLGRN